MDAQLDGYRQSIDNIDAALVLLLAERFKVTQAVGRYKAEAGLPPADPARETKQIERLRALAQDARLDPDFSEKFLRFIIDEVIRHYEKARDGAGGDAPSTAPLKTAVDEPLAKERTSITSEVGPTV